MRGDSLADWSVTDHERGLVAQAHSRALEDVCDREDARLPRAVTIVEARLGGGVVDRDDWGRENAGGAHRAQRGEARGGLLGDADPRAHQVRRGLVGQADQVRAVVHHHVEAGAEPRERGGAFCVAAERGVRVHGDASVRERRRDLGVGLVRVGVDGQGRHPRRASSSARFAVLGSSVIATPIARPSTRPESRRRAAIAREVGMCSPREVDAAGGVAAVRDRLAVEGDGAVREQRK